ncbi:MAG: hypothetical protein JRI66_11965 [Deltaproteobacteria bacterium]|nr:hypothetical protein [Deltaproteobacteria bacterium]
MSAQIIVKRIEKLGGKIVLDGDELVVCVPQKALTPGLKEILRKHKLEIVAYLKSSGQDPDGAAMPPTDPACPCGCPAWGRGRDGLSYCWACLALQAMTH